MFASSGNLQADRRLEFALGLRAEGDAVAAASVIEQALELVPDWEAAHFALAEAYEAAGRPDDAARHYAVHLRRVAADTRGASLRLALLGAAPVPAKAPAAYVRALFDEYAPRFEDSLVGRLGYHAPADLRAAVDEVRPPAAGGGRVLDLGCGTGLAGEAFRDRASRLEGVDLSPAMVARARRKGIYDALSVAGIEDHLATHPGGLDLVLACDVLIYFGDLGGVTRAARRVVVGGGLFAFTVQAATGDGFELGPDQRYAHAAPYLERVAAESGWRVARLRDAPPRTEAGRPVPGHLCVLA